MSAPVLTLAKATNTTAADLEAARERLQRAEARYRDLLTAQQTTVRPAGPAACAKAVVAVESSKEQIAVAWREYMQLKYRIAQERQDRLQRENLTHPAQKVENQP